MPPSQIDQGEKIKTGLDCPSAAVGDLDAGLEVAVDVHETPLVFPLFALFVVFDLPWLIECREPKRWLVS